MALLGFPQVDIREELERMERWHGALGGRQTVWYEDPNDYLAALEQDGFLWQLGLAD